VKRFYLRRGLKLYPSFYVCLALTVALDKYLHRWNGAREFLGEMFYVQNYGPYIWSHTWSLAVEEHFYFALPLLFLGLIWLSKDKSNPFRAVRWICAGLCIACLAARVWMVSRIPESHLPEWNAYRPVYVDTHTRADSLFFGVLLGYLYHFHGHWQEWVKCRSRVLVALAFPLLCCAFAGFGSRFMLTVGFTGLYLGFGIVLVLALSLRKVCRRR
jgi:peptidoglycan/LPS O-acetylase OafA/YrhL